MPRMTLEQVPPGRRLAAPVRMPSGRVLASAGIALDGVLLERLRQNGVAYITVEPVDGEALDVLSLEEQVAELEMRFRGHEDCARMMALKHLVLSRLGHPDFGTP